MAQLTKTAALRMHVGVPSAASAFVACAAVVSGYLILATPEFATPYNLAIVIRSAALVGIIAVGTTFVTISGNFFLLSVTETAAVSAMVFAHVTNAHFGAAEALVTTLGAAALIGASQGVFIGLGSNPIIVTLGYAGVLFGITSVLSGSKPISIDQPPSLAWLGKGVFLGMQTTTWIFIALAVVAEIVLRKTVFGRRVFLSGANRATSQAIGNRDFAVTVWVCAIASGFSGLVGVLTASQLSAAYLDNFTGSNGASGSLTLNAIAAVMLGGTAIAGGSGSALRSAFGAVFIALVDNIMVLRGYDTGPRTLFLGLAVLVSVSAYCYWGKVTR